MIDKLNGGDCTAIIVEFQNAMQLETDQILNEVNAYIVLAHIQHIWGVSPSIVAVLEENGVI